MILINDLSKAYKVKKKEYFIALNRLNLRFDNEEMIAIIGESGSGKSTFMNLVSTLDSPSGGYVQIDDNKITFGNERKKAQYRKEYIGFVFQSFNLISDMTILDNVAVAMEIAGCKKEERIQRAKELLTLVGLGIHINKKPGQLSGGQKQRVAIARALANDPHIILADEPTGALDAATSVEIMQLLKSIASSGKKVIIVTHDMKVASYCDRIVELSDGQIISDNVNSATGLETIKLPLPVQKSKKGLSLSGMLKLSNGALKRRWKRNLLVAIGTAIAISSLLVVNIASSTVNNTVEDLYLQYGNPDVVQTMVIDTTENGTDIEQIEKDFAIDQSQIKDRYRLENSILSYLPIVAGTNTNVSSTTLYPGGVSYFGPKDLSEGVEATKPDEIVVSEKFIETYKNEESVQLELGDSVKMSINNQETVEFTIVGITSDKSLKLQMQPSNVYFTYEFATQAKYLSTENTGMRTYIYVIDPTYRDEFVKNMATQQSSFASGTIPSSIVISLPDVMFLYLVTEGLSFVFDFFNVILAVSVVVAIIMIAVMIYVSILERMREIGVLRAIGARVRDIRRMFYIEAIFIGAMAGLLAIIMALVLGQVAVTIANNSTNILRDYGIDDIKMHVDVLNMIYAFLLSIVLSVVSSILSIGLGLKISPVEALKKK